MTSMSIRNQPAPQKKNKQVRGLVFLVSVISALGWSLFSVMDWMGDEKRLPLSQIIVQGELTYLSKFEIRDAVNTVGQLQSFMLQDVNVIQQAISTLPWISHVAVRKQWPDTIKVNVTEYKPDAIWNGIQLLDVSGNVFYGNLEQVNELELISLSGPQGSEKLVVEAFKQMRGILKPTKIQISELVLTSRRAWQIVTSENVRIELGRESRNERLHRFVDLFNKIREANRQIAYVDLRYDTGAAVGWKDASTVHDDKP